MATVRQKHARDPNEEIVEEGDIFFFYRPRVEQEEVEGPQDVQRFYMVMRPQGAGRFRAAVLGRKRLPDARSHERIWGFVDRVVRQGDKMETDLKEHHYATKTRGERTQPAACPAGEGVYALLRRGRNLHLTYELELPERPGEVQRELNIPKQGAFILSVRNPDTPSPPGAGLPERDEPHYPKPLQRAFRGRRFAAEDPRLLDYEGAEFVLVGARTDPERAYDTDSPPSTRPPSTPTSSVPSSWRGASIRSRRSSRVNGSEGRRGGPLPYLTMIVPTICGCNVQKYL
jgi:hypothetical protein